MWMGCSVSVSVCAMICFCLSVSTLSLSLSLCHQCVEVVCLQEAQVMIFVVRSGSCFRRNLLFLTFVLSTPLLQPGTGARNHICKITV